MRSDALAYILAAYFVVLHFYSSSPQTLPMIVAFAVPIYSSSFKVLHNVIEAKNNRYFLGRKDLLLLNPDECDVIHMNVFKNRGFKMINSKILTYLNYFLMLDNFSGLSLSKKRKFVRFWSTSNLVLNKYSILVDSKY